jgi:hypothetical protein
MPDETIQFEKSWVLYVSLLLMGWVYLLIRGRYPLLADGEGITTRSGKRHLWADAVEVRDKQARGGLGVLLLGGGVDIRFSTGWVGIYPNLFKNGRALRDRALAMLKEKKGLQLAA